MKIGKVKISEYKKDFIASTNLGSDKYSYRKGWYLQIFADDCLGIGEASPLPNISLDSHSQAGYALQGFSVALKDIDYSITLEELLLLSEVHGHEAPSAKFAMQSAIYDVFSKINQTSIAKYLNKKSSQVIKINSIFNKRSIIPIQDTQVLKIKISDSNIYSIKELVEKVYKQYNQDIKLRLDFNGALDLPRAIRICKELSDYNIEYIEQPVLSLDDLYEIRMHSDIPIAVDELLSDYQTAEKIIESDAADVFIIKPSMTGGFCDVKKIVDLARGEQIKIVLTSAFETYIGQAFIAHIASALKIKDYCGIFNISLFKDEVYPKIISSEVNISDIKIHKVT